MITLLPIHILAAFIALLSGYVALFAGKGAPLHRKAGMVFVYGMLTMSLSAASIAAVKSESINVTAGLLTFYFVVTGLLTVRRAATPRWISVTGVALALSVGLLAFRIAYRNVAARASRSGATRGVRAVALLGAVGDAGAPQRRHRREAPHKRHLWRMCLRDWSRRRRSSGGRRIACPS